MKRMKSPEKSRLNGVTVTWDRPQTRMILFGLLLALSSQGQAAEPDWTSYQQLLTQYVSTDNRAGIRLNVVDYATLGKDPRFAQLVSGISRFSPAQLATREERLAFYINVYNILAIKTVVDHWPVDSIRDIGSFFRPVWKHPAGAIGGNTVSLDEIEHKILRPLGEPRIHLAIVCASISCPDLRREPYTAAQLDHQLDEQVAGFLANPGKGLRIEEDEVRVSKIFDWFAEDFEHGYRGVDNFIRHYRADLPANLAIRANIDYNWSLNHSGENN